MQPHRAPLQTVRVIKTLLAARRHAAQPHSAAYSPWGWVGFLPKLPLPLPRSDCSQPGKGEASLHLTMLRCSGEGHQRHVLQQWFPAGIGTLLGFTGLTSRADHPLAVSVESEMLFLWRKDAENFTRRQHDATWKPSTLFFLTRASREPWPTTGSGSDEGCSQSDVREPEAVLLGRRAGNGTFAVLPWHDSPLSFFFLSGQEATRSSAGAVEKGWGSQPLLGKGLLGGKKNHKGSFFSPTAAFWSYAFSKAAICYPGSVFPVTPLAAWWSWEAFRKQQSQTISPCYPLCACYLILNTFPCAPQKSVTVLLEQAVWVLEFCPAPMKSCQSATELLRGWDYWSSCLQVFPWHDARDNLALWVNKSSFTKEINTFSLN